MNHIGTREIATERLTLRRFEIEDAENMFYNWANDPEVTKYLTWPAHESVDTTETILKEWISKYDEKDFYQWAIELNDLEQPIGTISVIKTDQRHSQLSSDFLSMRSVQDAYGPDMILKIQIPAR